MFQVIKNKMFVHILVHCQNVLKDPTVCIQYTPVYKTLANSLNIFHFKKHTFWFIVAKGKQSCNYEQKQNIFLTIYLCTFFICLLHSQISQHQPVLLYIGSLYQDYCHSAKVLVRCHHLMYSVYFLCCSW